MLLRREMFSMEANTTMNNSREKAMAKAVAYIDVKPRTKRQVVQYLRKKEFDGDVIQQVIAELEEYHYIDDFDYSVLYFQYGFEKGRGVGRIRRELMEKGVGTDIIDMAYEELEDVPDQAEMAMSIAASMIDGLDVETMEYDEKRKLQGKIGRRLAGRGFSSDVIYQVINRLV